MPEYTCNIKSGCFLQKEHLTSISLQNLFQVIIYGVKSMGCITKNNKKMILLGLLVTIQTFLHQLTNLSGDFIFVRDKCALINSLLLRLTLIVSINMRCAS